MNCGSPASFRQNRVEMVHVPPPLLLYEYHSKAPNVSVSRKHICDANTSLFLKVEMSVIMALLVFAPPRSGVCIKMLVPWLLCRRVPLKSNKREGKDKLCAVLRETGPGRVYRYPSPTGISALSLPFFTLLYYQNFRAPAPWDVDFLSFFSENEFVHRECAFSSCPACFKRCSKNNMFCGSKSTSYVLVYLFVKTEQFRTNAPKATHDHRIGYMNENEHYGTS